MDGAYITSSNKEDIINILVRAFRSLAIDFMVVDTVVIFMVNA